MTATVKTFDKSTVKSDFISRCPELNYPFGIAMNNVTGDIYITDSALSAVFFIKAGEPLGETFLTSLQMGKIFSPEYDSMHHPTAITYTSDGSLYLALYFSHVVLKVSLDGSATVLAGKLGSKGQVDGLLGESRLIYPYGITKSLNESIIYVSENFEEIFGVPSLRAIDLKNGVVRTVVGGLANGFKDGPAMTAEFRELGQIATHPITGSFSQISKFYIDNYENRKHLHC